MAKTSVIPDAELRDLLDKRIPQAQIAALYKVSPALVSKRVKHLEQAAAGKLPAVVQSAHASVWDTRDALQQNYDRAMALLSDPDVDRVAAVREVRNHIALGMQILETLYTVQDVRDFMEEVLAVIDSVDPSAKNTILARLREKRAVRAAFLPH